MKQSEYTEEYNSNRNATTELLPYNGEVPSKAVAITFWDHLIEEHLDIEKTWMFHSQKKQINDLIADQADKDRTWKQFTVREIIDVLEAIANGLQPEEIIIRGDKLDHKGATAFYRFARQEWVFHLGSTVENSLYIQFKNKRKGINKAMRRKLTSVKKSKEARNFFSNTAQLFLETSPFKDDPDFQNLSTTVDDEKPDFDDSDIWDAFLNGG